MKTVLVVYANEKLTKKETAGLKTYAFNTRASLKVGDRIESPDYDTLMQVVDVLPKAYRFVNVADGKLGDRRDSTRQFEIRELILRTAPSSENVVYATKI